MHLWESTPQKLQLQHLLTLLDHTPTIKVPFSQREKARVVKFSKLFSTAVRMAHNSPTPQSYPILRKKACVPSGEHVNAVDPCCMVPIEDMLRPALHSVSASGNYSKYSESYHQENTQTLLSLQTTQFILHRVQLPDLILNPVM